MKLMIDKMRADFALVIAARRAAGLWAAGDEAQAGREIARLVEAKSDEGLLGWSRWLARLALQDLLGVSDLAELKATARNCAECALHGKADDEAARCHGRDGMIRLYGKAHPLALLPDDGAASCARFTKREGA